MERLAQDVDPGQTDGPGLSARDARVARTVCDKASMMNIRSIASWLGRAMEVIAHAAAAMSAVILIAMIGLILIEIVMRNVLGLSLGWAGELVGYGVAAITFNALAYTMQRNALIRVSLVAGLAARYPRLGRSLDFMCLSVTLLGVSLAVTYFWYSIIRHWARGSVSATRAEVPLWIAEGFVLLGLALFLLQLVVSLANLLVGNTNQASAGLLVRDEMWGSRATQVRD